MSGKTIALEATDDAPALEMLRVGDGTRVERLPLVFLHGYTSGAWQFAAHVMPRLADEGWQCHTLNLRGHGGSDGRDDVRRTRFADYTDDVSRAVARVEVDTGRVPVLVGHSLGSVLARDHAARRPVAGLALVSFGDIAIGMRGFVGWMMKRYPVRGTLGMLTGRPSSLFTRFDPQYDVMYAGHDRETVRPNVERLMAQPDSDKVFMELSRLDIGDMASPAPVLVMAGDRDPIASVNSVHALARRYDTDPVILRGQAHDLFAAPDHENATRVLSTWLDRFDVRGGGG